MDARGIKHAAKMSEWSERIRACRSSGKPVKTWCEENGINIKSYYRWERLYMAEATKQMEQSAESPQPAGSTTTALVRIEPERLPVEKSSVIRSEEVKTTGDSSIILRHGSVELELPKGMEVSRIAELVKALSEG